MIERDVIARGVFYLGPRSEAKTYTLYRSVQQTTQAGEVEVLRSDAPYYSRINCYGPHLCYYEIPGERHARLNRKHQPVRGIGSTSNSEHRLAEAGTGVNEAGHPDEARQGPGLRIGVRGRVEGERWRWVAQFPR